MTKRKKEYVELDGGEICEVVLRGPDYAIVAWNSTTCIKVKSPKNSTEQKYKAQFSTVSL